MLYRVQTLTSHNAEESENSPESPHLGEIKRMRKQCVPGALPFFARDGDEAILWYDLLVSKRSAQTEPSYLMGEKLMEKPKWKLAHLFLQY